MRLSFSKGWLALALLMAIAAPGLAADNPVVGMAAVGDDGIITVAPEPEPWGGSSDTALVVGAGDVTPPADNVTYVTVVSSTTGLGVSQTSAAQVDWWYQFSLPNGALLQRVQVEACDTSATAQLAFGIARGIAPAGAAANISNVGGTGVAATPGCAFFSVTPTATTSIANAANDYWVFFDFSGTGLGTTIQIHSLRIYYRLQVSPAPAVATFPNDVPTSHPFFRFIEAMAASGVTGGCGAGSFCPDQAVTRGQMAVFLATALGLHFPN